ncbi:Phosphate-repressible phosphate permease pho-4 [Smittium culicis]|uniref:Phosphate transporter n=1 Tax=Smittium culicis TaxID=133412 RepID=A0A1R1Y2G6_9FUNG|nr:Phosphate-repressible phosphate permease pho-4 [Smittium culicis]OMJ21060.1 Phosphate-repressible phosphate permease pho-4 [Smittium culicis]
MMEIHQYTHVFVLAMIFSFADAYGMGANDVANSFATSVASGTLTLKEAVCIAIFTEFIGAFFLGAQTSSTISGGIIDATRFKNQPELLMLGMTTSVFGSATWVIFATSRGWPVSSTHSVIGAIIGMGITAYGLDTVKWGYDGIAKIVTSWFVSPFIAAAVSATIYLLSKYFIFEHKNSFDRGLKAIPIYIFFTFLINLAFIISNGMPGSNIKTTSFRKIVGISAAISLIISIFSYFFYSSWLKRKIINKEDMKFYHILFTPFLGPQPLIKELTEDQIAELKQNTDIEEQKESQGFMGRVKKIVLRGVNKDVRNLDNPELESIHARAKKYDNNTELLFEFIQVLTSCAASFAHGSNDVSNAVGPLSAVYHIWKTAEVPNDQTKVALWNLAYCAIGIDIGLATYGYHLMRTLGNNITYTTPSRGFAAELGTSLTIVTASRIGIPVSTTHCITGAMVGVGLCNGDMKAINWKMFAVCFLSWVITLPAAGLLSGILFALIAYSPQKIS